MEIDSRMQAAALIASLSKHLPNVVRWSGGIARRLRHFDVALTGKSSGSSSTDALTLTDLTVQELIVGALRDCDPAFRSCRLEAEEATGDIARFAENSDFTIAIDPIDGTRAYRDKHGDGYSVVVHLRSPESVLYSLVYIPEKGPHGTWVEVVDDRIKCGPDDPARPAVEVLESLPPLDRGSRPRSNKIYLIGFQHQDAHKATAVTSAGLEGYVAEKLPGSIFELMARGEFGGSLIHTPNVYDFPVSLHIARVLGGDALWVHSGEPVHFRKTWNDERADMLRLPGIVACSDSRATLDTLCGLARSWSPERYSD